MELRDYQTDVVNKSREYFSRGIRKQLLRLPTGAGKTVIATYILKNAAARGLRCWFNVHRKELIDQSAETFYKFGLHHGIVAANYPEEPQAPVQICSIGTLARRLHNQARPDLIIWDEGHHCASKSWTRIFQTYPDAYHILLTATPERLDGRGLSDYARVMIEGPDTGWLIENGHLCDYKAYAPSTVSMAGVKKQMGDFKKKEAVELVDRPTITGSAVSEYLKLTPGKPGVVFAITIEHSEHIVQEFRAAGVNAYHLDGNTPSRERADIIQAYKKGDIQVLSNVGLFGEGFDLPALSTLIMLRPTDSLSLYLQMCGRVLRTAEEKTHAVILDHVGNIERHGLPDLPREWSLQGRDKKKRGASDSAPVKICDKCFGAQMPGKKVCEYCGHEFEIQEREITEQEGELVEIDKRRQMFERKREQAGADTLEGLIKLGYSRGYKSPERWAQHVYEARIKKRSNR